MKVFVAGATGALGTELVPQLAAAGNDVIGMTRSPAKTDMLRSLGPGRSWPTRSILTRSPVPWPRPSPR
jgi:nucleoside-diphosphate-sugar epimerase